MYDSAKVIETAVDHAPLIERAFSFIPRELDYVIEDIRGEIPSFVRGSYYLNGPGRFSRGDVQYRHWLDGDGMVYALHFDDNNVRFVNRFVRSKKFVAEESEKNAIFRTFGTAFDGDSLKRGLMIEPPVNVSVYPFAGKLLAFGEQGLPYQLDLHSLETLGQFDFGGSLNDISPFAAHPKIDPQTGEMFNFGISFSAQEPFLNLYRFDKQAQPIYRQRLKLDYAASLHDFGLSENYAIFYVHPYILDMQALSRGGKTLQESLSWQPALNSYLLIAGRETGEIECALPVGNRYCLHFINCFEADGLLNVDLLELERPVYDQYQPLSEMFANVSRGVPRCFRIDMRQRELIDSIALDYANAPDFPSVAPTNFMRSYTDFWMLGISAAGKSGRKFFDQLVHANWSGRAFDVYTAPPNCYLGGEPVFIPDTDANEKGLVICQLFEAENLNSSFLLFDANDIAKGAVAKLNLKEPIPFGFHASFIG